VEVPTEVELTREQAEARDDLGVAFANFSEAYADAQAVGFDPQPFLMQLLGQMLGPGGFDSLPAPFRMLFG
jgi:hypothetical protein